MGYKVSLEPSLLQAEQPQLSQPVLIAEVLQSSDHHGGPPLDSFQQVHVLCWEAQSWTLYSRWGSHESGADGQNHLPQPAGHDSCDAAQGTGGFLGYQCTLLHPQVLLLRAALNPFSAQPVFVLGIAPTQVQDLARGLVELYEVHTGPPLKPVQDLLDDIPSIQCVDRTTQLGVVSKLAEGVLNSTVHVSNKDVQQHWSQFQPLRNATHQWSPLGLRAIDHDPWNVDHPANSLSTEWSIHQIHLSPI
ncbi:hypothetical protein llap_9237 [Limosa lapponica baueri]|uniref:Uncharacterized protein n=1 Tax=Limosa lapponica baueri TaxID=1758121 RepID=A0A2I0U368_LIMLA|nr:hypothetical protein llap_9237 [Limosa lapponica baueri]